MLEKRILYSVGACTYSITCLGYDSPCECLMYNHGAGEGEEGGSYVGPEGGPGNDECLPIAVLSLDLVWPHKGGKSNKIWA